MNGINAAEETSDGDIKGNGDEPGNTRLERIMKERFGKPDFGAIMGNIVEEMFKTVDKKKDGK